jgi:WD40-like Beta Propeller Repeat
MRPQGDRRFVRNYRWLSLFSLSLVLLLQACGGSDSGNFNSKSTKGGSGNIGVNNAAFTGNILFVKAGNIFILHGKDDSLTQLTQDGTAFQPSISPDGTSIAFELRKAGNDYSDIATMPIAGGNPTMLTDDSLHDRSTGAPEHYLFWAGNPIWTSDGRNIIYLSDFFKGGNTTPFPNQTCLGNSTRDWILDMGIVELPTSARPVSGGQLRNPPKQLAWPYCYAGGDQDLTLRPGVNNTQVLFTSFQYSGPNLDLITQMSLLNIPSKGNSSMIQLSPADPKSVAMEPSFSPDGKYITYIRRENGEDDLFIMPIDAASVTGTPNDEHYFLIRNGESVYYTNTGYYQQSQKLASGIIGQPVWGANNTLFFIEFNNGEFNLFMAKVKFTTPTPPATTPTPGVTPTPVAPAAPVISLDGAPIQLTQGGIDGTARPDWFQ